MMVVVAVVMVMARGRYLGTLLTQAPVHEPLATATAAAAAAAAI
jgi:hypothetical protein